MHGLWGPRRGGQLLRELRPPVRGRAGARACRGGDDRRARPASCARRDAGSEEWAIASGAWLCTGWIVALLIFSSISGSAGGCKGGIDRFSVPTFSSTDNTHWTATYSCYDGGTKTVAYHGQVP